MKDTRNFDRAPLKDLRVKDNQIGVRTPQVLMSREAGDYQKGDILDANATMLAIKQASGSGNVDIDLSNYLPITGGTIKQDDKWSNVNLAYSGITLYQQNTGKAFSRMRIAGSLFDICRCETTDENKIDYNSPDYKISVNSSKATMYGSNKNGNGWKFCTEGQKINDVLSGSGEKQLDTPSLYLTSVNDSVGYATAITTRGAIFGNSKDNYVAIQSKARNNRLFAEGYYNGFSGIEIKSNNNNMSTPVFCGINIILPDNCDDLQYIKAGINIKGLNNGQLKVFSADGGIKTIGYDIASQRDLITLQQAVEKLHENTKALSVNSLAFTSENLNANAKILCDGDRVGLTMSCEDRDLGPVSTEFTTSGLTFARENHPTKYAGITMDDSFGAPAVVTSNADEDAENMYFMSIMTGNKYQIYHDNISADSSKSVPSVVIDTNGFSISNEEGEACYSSLNGGFSILEGGAVVLDKAILDTLTNKITDLENRVAALEAKA